MDPSVTDPPVVNTAPHSTRRRACQQIALACLSPAAFGPWFHPHRRPIVRVLGTHVTLQEAIRRKAEEDLQIELRFQPGGSAEVLQQASTRPETFDVFEQWSNTIRILWQADAVQAVDTERIDAWNDINPLTKTGKLTPDAPIGQGDAPHGILHIQPDGSLGANTTSKAAFLPYVHNVDSFGYSTRHVPEGEPYETESWGWLLDPQWHGKVALVNEPTIGIFDAALAAQAQGLVEFEDIGNIRRDEMESLLQLLISMRHQGHFFGAWNSVPQSVDFMRHQGVVIQSMFSPAVATLNSLGYPVHYAAPKEGYRAWHGVMCLSSRTQGESLDASYRFLNWWLSGWPGAFIARQGYYISVPERAREYLSDDEWDYWYAGKRAAQDLPGTDGRVAVKKGTTRRGGAYLDRFSRIAVWNTVMDTYEYSLQRWHEFLLS